MLLVTKSSDTRIQQQTKWVYAKIKELFGKDVADRFVVMTTFADATEPNVVPILRANGMPFKRYFKFNNSALFVKSKDKSVKDWWKMCMNNIK